MSSADPRLPRLGLVRERAEDARHLVAALVEIGAAPLFEGDGAELSADAVRADGIEVLVVGLGADVDPHVLVTLDRVRVVFDDLAATAGLTGWDRARWLRHLRAKLLGVAEEGPPRPAGAEGIPVRQSALIPHGEGRVEPPAAVDAADPRIGAARATWTSTADGTASDWPVPAGDPALRRGRGEADAPEPETELAGADPGLDAVDAPPFGVQALRSPGSDGPPGDTIEAAGVGEDFLDADPIDAAEPSWSGSAVADAGARATGPAVVGLDELLDALRREDPDHGRSAFAAGAEPPATAVAPASAPVVPPRAFDLSSLSLEPLEGERPTTGRAQFLVEEAPRASAPSPEPSAAPAPPSARPGVAATSAWLLAAGDADPDRVTRFAESLPAGLDALILLVRPTSAPWLGATLAVDGADSLPLVLADEVMEPTGGRIVVLSPGERAGFNRSGRLTVQPGDHSLPEALGDWMTMRALAARFGRDAGVVVFGRLRDEVLEGAIELARAGGQVWFEASVLEEPNPVVDAARAAGIAMRTGSAAELAQALVARLRA